MHSSQQQMQGILQLISNPTITNSSLSSRLKQLPKSQSLERKIHSTKQFQHSINLLAISNSILPNKKLSDFAQSFQYKKMLVKQYFKKSLPELEKERDQLQSKISWLKSLLQFLNCYNACSKENTEKMVSTFSEFEAKYVELRGKVKDEGVGKQVEMKYKHRKREFLENFQKFVEKRGNPVKMIIRPDLEVVITRINHTGLLKYWMFTMFDQLISYDSENKMLNLVSLIHDKDLSLTQENSIPIKNTTLSFKNPENVDQFLEEMKKTFELVEWVHNRIKKKLVLLIEDEKISDSDKLKYRYKESLEEIKEGQREYWEKVKLDIAPSLYLFNIGNRNKIYEILDKEAKRKTDSMASLLLNYKYCTSSKLTKEDMDEITDNIVNLIIKDESPNTTNQEFQRVCFFLQAKIELDDIKDTSRSDADMLFLLVSKLIQRCMDSISYEKIEKLYKIEKAIREFKLRKQKGSV